MLLTNLATYSPGARNAGVTARVYLPTHPRTNVLKYQRTYVPAYQRTNLSTYQPTNLPTYLRTTLSTVLGSPGAREAGAAAERRAQHADLKPDLAQIVGVAREGPEPAKARRVRAVPRLVAGTLEEVRWYVGKLLRCFFATLVSRCVGAVSG